MGTIKIRCIGFLLCLLVTSCTQKDNSLTGDDINLFKDGPAWELAKAVQENDTIKVNKILSQSKVLANYQEPKFGETLLEWAVWTDHYISSKALLENGADPNLQDTYDGDSAFLYAADKFETSDYVKLLLKYKGNPNAVAKNDSTNRMCTPLIAAGGSRLESVKLLVDAGANINYMTKTYRCALLSAFNFGKVEIVRYLLIDKCADFKRPFGRTIDGENIMITNLLTEWVFPLDSKEYKVKMEIVEYLEARGMDYWKTPIPQHYYKHYSKVFLSKY